MLRSLWTFRLSRTIQFCDFCHPAMSNCTHFIHIPIKYVRYIPKIECLKHTDQELPVFTLLYFDVEEIWQQKKQFTNPQAMMHSCGKRSDYEPVASEHHWEGSIVTDECSGVTSSPDSLWGAMSYPTIVKKTGRVCRCSGKEILQDLI